MRLHFNASPYSVNWHWKNEIGKVLRTFHYSERQILSLALFLLLVVVFNCFLVLTFLPKYLFDGFMPDHPQSLLLALMCEISVNWLPSPSFLAQIEIWIKIENSIQLFCSYFKFPWYYQMFFSCVIFSFLFPFCCATKSNNTCTMMDGGGFRISGYRLMKTRWENENGFLFLFVNVRIDKWLTWIKSTQNLFSCDLNCICCEKNVMHIPKNHHSHIIIIYAHTSHLLQIFRTIEWC